MSGQFIGTSMRSMMNAYNAGLRDTDHFPSPFLDMASTAMPEDIRNALEWCEYIMMANGTYRQAMERIVSYFNTDLDIGSAGDQISDDEKEKWENLFLNELNVKGHVHSANLDLMCFHGDTKAVTEDGVFRLRDLAGKTVRVLSKDGVYRKAEFKSFGKQELLEVMFSDGRTVLATAEHEWLVKNCSGREVVVQTQNLKRGHSIRRTVAPRPPRNAEFFEGVRHGFVFGDGSKTSTNRTAAVFFGHKDAAMIPYFDGHGTGSKPWPGSENATVTYGLPGHYKQLPNNSHSASYWYGFVCGFLAADGSVDIYGCALLTQKSKTALEAIAEQLPRIGMCAGPVRTHIRTASFVRDDGTEQVYTGPMSYVTLLKRFMRPEDFLIPAHRENFERHFNPQSKYGEYIRIKAVNETGVVDEVFCCVEMETHTFVIDQAILTKQCYGNAFMSFVVPFKRFLMCPKCKSMWTIKEVYENSAFKFKFTNWEFTGSCPQCSTGSGWRGKWIVHDEPETRPERLTLKKWSPHEMNILHDEFTGEVAYLWKIPEDYKHQVRKGTLFHLERVSSQVLKAIKNNQLFRFAPNVIYHMKEPCLGGIRNRGWGISRIIANFRQVWYVQVLHRYNEAIALDYVIPFRLVTPKDTGSSSGAGGDILLSTDMGDAMSQIRRMIRWRRRDPAQWHTLGFPVEYQVLGGDATELAPSELLNQGIDTMLNAAGTPVELYKNTLQLQVAPVALRMFEATWHHLVHGNNMFLRWTVERISEILNWESVDVRHQRVTHADDMQRHMAILQMAMGGAVSLTSALRTLGLNFKDEVRNLTEEGRFQQEQQAEVQEEMDQVAFGQQLAKGMPQGGGGMPPGGGMMAPGGQQGGGAGPAGPTDPNTGQPIAGMAAGPVTAMVQGSGMPTTMDDMMSAAKTLANELMGLPEGQKDSELKQLRQKNEALHHLVVAEMDKIRSNARSQGGQMLITQQYGGG